MRVFKEIILRIRRLFYILIGFISKIIRKLFYSNNSRDHKLIAVCGRGYSAKKFFFQDYSLHTKVYLANYSTNDLPGFGDYLKLKNKDISIVSNISEPVPNIFYSLFFDLRETIISRPECLLNSKEFNSTREVFRLEALGLKVRGVKNSRSMNDYPMSLGNTGILALYEACFYARINNIKSILIYGFDLYSTEKNLYNSLEKDCLSYEAYISHRNVNKKLSKQMDYLISLYPEIQFQNFTLNHYDFKSENIENIYVDYLIK